MHATCQSNLLTALVVGWLLAQTQGLAYGERVVFVTLVALAGLALARFVRCIE